MFVAGCWSCRQTAQGFAKTHQPECTAGYLPMGTSYPSGGCCQEIQTDLLASEMVLVS